MVLACFEPVTIKMFTGWLQRLLICCAASRKVQFALVHLAVLLMLLSRSSLRQRKAFPL